MTKKKPPVAPPTAAPDKVHEPEIERDQFGRFALGHRPSGYSPVSRAGFIKRHHIITNTPIEQVMEVMNALRKQAAGGNAHAAGLWMAYAVGAPEKFVEKDDAQTVDALHDLRPIEDLTNEQKLQRLALLEVELQQAEKVIADAEKPK